MAVPTLREHVKKTCILRSLDPPPELLANARFYAIFFYMYKYKFLKPEKPKMDDIEKKFNILRKFLTDAKMSHNIFCIFFCFKIFYEN